MGEILITILIGFFICAMWFAGFALVTFIAQLLWNCIIVNIFNTKRITFWQMMGLIILLNILIIFHIFILLRLKSTNYGNRQTRTHRYSPRTRCRTPLLRQYQSIVRPLRQGANRHHLQEPCEHRHHA